MKKDAKPARTFGFVKAQDLFLFENDFLKLAARMLRAAGLPPAVI